MKIQVKTLKSDLFTIECGEEDLVGPSLLNIFVASFVFVTSFSTSLLSRFVFFCFCCVP